MNVRNVLRRSPRSALRAGIAALALGAPCAPAGPVHEVVAAFDRPASEPFYGALAAGPDGWLWGATYGGGVNSRGTIYKVKPDAGAWQAVLAFSGNGAANKGANPNAGFLLDSRGLFWGTTMRGGAADLGTVFKLDPAKGTLVTVLEFTGNGAGNKGAVPRAGLVRGDDGMLWGTTGEGGAAGHGTVFKINPLSGALTTVVEFTDNGASNKGKAPQAALARGSGGLLWGTTTAGGAAGAGTVFKIDTATGALSTVVQFTGSTGAAPGSYAGGALADDGAGFFWGTTYWGGSYSRGSIYKVNAATGAYAQVLSFAGISSANQGAFPRGALAPDGEGNLWGTTLETGGSGSTTSDNGTVFKVSIATGVLTTVAVFNKSAGPPLGRNPQGDLYQDSAGYVWGTTSSGGLSDNGTVYRIRRATGALETAVDFTTGNISPNAGLASDLDGILWGTSPAGGALEFGSVFKIDPRNNQLTTVVEFTDNGAVNKGRTPVPGLTLAADGWLWGVTYDGGSGGNGTIFKLNPATGALVTVKDISRDEGGFANPNSPLVADGNGFLWGTTNAYGSNGSVFKIEAASGTMTTVFRFTRQTGAYKGAFPYGGLMADGNGWFWGTTSRGGAGDNGTVFKYQPSTGAFTTLAEFTYTSGAQPGFMPMGRLVRDASGFVWGTASGGGSANYGTVFKINQATGAFATVLQFTGNGASNKGSGPYGGMCFDGTSLWGTTREGGTTGIGNGTVYRINPATGALTTVVTFAGAGNVAFSGRKPSDGALWRHTDGHIYGATGEGGPGGLGTVFRLRFGPLVTTQSAASVAAVSARLRGTVNANGLSSPVSFEYSTDPALQGAATVHAGTAAGSGTSSFNSFVGGLLPGTTYYFRIVSSNAENPLPQRGEILSFATQPNQAPVFGGYALGARPLTPVAIPLRKLLARASDPDGDALAVTAAGPASAQGGSVVLDSQAGTVVYTPPGFVGDDTFPVTITDARGVATTGAVTASVTAEEPVLAMLRNPPQVTVRPDGVTEVRFHAIPGRGYWLEHSTDTLTWRRLQWVSAGPAGLIEYSDPGPPLPKSFYRLALP